MSDARILRALLRQDFSAFLEKSFAELEPGTAFEPTWHLDHLAWQLTRLARGDIRRLIVCVPPRSMKSLTASVAYPAWRLGRNPRERIICVSYADELAAKFSTDTRRLMTSRWYRNTFPQTELVTVRQNELGTTERGSRVAAGIGGSILGRGADLIVVDDPIKATEALSKAKRRQVNDSFDNTISTRLNDKRTGQMMIIMQRHHEDDLVGHVMETGDWELTSIPAIETQTRTYRVGDHPRAVHRRGAGEVLSPREPIEVLEGLRRQQGSLVFSAQYQQEPVPPEGNIVRREWLRTYTARPEEFDLTIVSWDTASTTQDSSDYSVGTVWGARGLDYYLLDVVRGRFEVPELRRRVVELHRLWKADQTVIETTDIGRAILQDLRRMGELHPILIPPKFDKEARFLAQSCRFEAGQVHVPQDAHWLAEWLSELLAFPNGKHDDQVDSTSQALHQLSARMHPLVAPPTPRPQHTVRPQTTARPQSIERPLKSERTIRNELLARVRARDDEAD